MKNKHTRVRCTDEEFLSAVFSSKTYQEVAEKTGQKLTSTVARYYRTKKILAERHIDIPIIKKAHYLKNTNNVDELIDIVKKLKEHYKGV